MPELFDLIFRLLTTPPGNLAYFLALSFSVLAALQASINNYRRSGFPQGSRMVAGLALLLIAQLAQFAIAGLAWLGLLDTALWLPPVDRAVALVSILTIAWLWLAPERSRLADVTLGLFLLMIAGFFILTLLWWSDQATQYYFNASWPDWSANWSAMVVLVLGMVSLLVRRPNGWGIGIAMLALLFTGQLFHYLMPQNDSDYAGPVRLAQLMAFPWLMTLSSRFPLGLDRVSSSTQIKTAERQRYTADPQTVQEFIGLLDTMPDQGLCLKITRLVSRLMLADICLFISSNSAEGGLMVACGYNLIEEKNIPGYNVDVRLAPMILHALQRGKPLRLPASSTSSDLQALALGMHMPRVGHLLAVPISADKADTQIGLVLLSPFSNRGWGSEEQNVLLSYARFVARVIQPKQIDASVDEELGELRAALLTAEDDKKRLVQQLESLQVQPITINDQDFRSDSSAQSQQTVETIEDTVKGGKRSVRPSDPGIDMYRLSYEDLQANLRFALEQIAELRHELAQAGKRQVLVNVPPPATEAALEALLRQTAQDSDSFVGRLQELNQPIASVLGYTDLLLGESIGILGAMQRKFLERIRVSVERISGLLEDLLQLTSFDEEDIKIDAQKTHLLTIVDAAMQEAKGYLEEKEIHLRVDIPQELPLLQLDTDSMRQAISSLIRKAGECSPFSGEVHLQARLETGDQEPGFVLFQVSDFGEGIPQQELPRVFSRVHTQDPSPMNGMDLATVKAVIEAHGGRIWVDSTIGKGATYSAVLPITGS
jgi:signal transduction histidine kinase